MYVDPLKSILSAFVELLRKQKKLRRKIIFTSFGIFILTIIIYFVLTKNLNLSDKIIDDYSYGIGFIFLLLFFISLYSEIPIEKIKKDIFDVELEEVKKKKEEIEEKIKDTIRNEGNTDILNIIDLNLNQINEYYIINKKQAQISYNVSLFFIFVGLSTLFGGIWFFNFGTNKNITLAYLSGIGGIIINVIGGINFQMYNKNIEQLNYFYKTLVRLQNTMLAVKLCESIENLEKKSENKEKIIASLIK